MNELPRINQTAIKTWRNCEQKFDYQFTQHLEAKRPARPLHIGSWVHACLEGHYRDGDWRIKHTEYLRAYENLAGDDRLALDKGNNRTKGPYEPLPQQVARIMRSYLWYHRHDDWKVIAVEQEFEVPFTKVFGDYVPGWTLDQYAFPFIFKGRIDLIVEDADGLLWVVDHKTTDKIPAQGAFHAMEPQLILYPWAAEIALGIRTAGVIYNYLRSSPPTIPKMNKDGVTISATEITTDYPTAVTFLREHGRKVADYSDYLLPLKADSPLMARYQLPREEAVTQRILVETMTTARAIMQHEGITRNVNLQCEWCPYKALCRAELFGLDTTLMRKRDYQVVDPAAAVSVATEEVLT